MKSQARAIADTSRPTLDSSSTLRPAGTRTRADSLKAAADSAKIALFLPPASGTIDPRTDSLLVVTRDELQWLDHRSLPDLLEYLPGVMLRDQSSAGQYTEPTIDGVGWRSIGVLWNGRTLADPITGVYNPHLASTDYLERLEYVDGARAFLYGSNSTGGVVNMVTRNYNSNRPFSRLRFAQSGYGYALTDGTFAQNISRRVNVTAGFQFLGTDGRYQNSLSEAWNIRGKIRYGIADNLTVTLSEYFSSTNTDLNGGLRFDSTAAGFAFTPTAATIVNPDSYEKITRHDLDLTIIGGFLPDTSDLSTLTFYTSRNLREYRDEENRPYANGILIQSDHNSFWSGVQGSQFLTLDAVHLLAAGMVEAREVQRSPNIGQRYAVASAVWGKGELQLGGVANLAVFGRLDHLLGYARPGVGSDVMLTLDSTVSLFGGLSLSHRLPNFMEKFWTDSTVARVGDIGPERHVVADAGIRLALPSGSSGRLAITHRRITNPILFLPNARPSVFPGLTIVNGDKVEMTTADLTLSLLFWRIQLEGTATYFINRSGATTSDDLPRAWLYGGIYYRDRTRSGSLDLKAGFRGWYRSGSRGMVFNPEIVAYVPNTGTALGQSGSVDFVAIAHIGDAYVDLTWENLPGIAYYGTPYYPGLDRELRITVGWDFWN